ncbi:unnamed protein product [Schistosoma mattheei]|uniref:Uncharacterized protein n=1 Tax=Schistosoma mattheei TaxID=31246 RepID=A0A183Q8G2_9TREM|nr:unnamed protein product [Schistosoma mattheei]
MISKRKQANLEKVEAKRLADKLKLENEFNNHLNQIENWINSIKDLIENKTNGKLKHLQVRCTSNGLSIIVGQLQNILDEQSKVSNILKTHDLNH